MSTRSYIYGSTRRQGQMEIKVMQRGQRLIDINIPEVNRGFTEVKVISRSDIQGCIFYIIQRSRSTICQVQTEVILYTSGSNITKIKFFKMSNRTELVQASDSLVRRSASTEISGSPQILFSSSCHVSRSRTARGTTDSRPFCSALICEQSTHSR